MRVLAAALLVLTLAGCGGGGASKPTFWNAESVSEGAGMTNCTPDSEPELGVTDAVTCDQGTVNWFKSGDALKGWARIVKQVDASGLGGGEVLYGDNWAIECDSVSDCADAQTGLGGTIR